MVQAGSLYHLAQAKPDMYVWLAQAEPTIKREQPKAEAPSLPSILPDVPLKLSDVPKTLLETPSSVPTPDRAHLLWRWPCMWRTLIPTMCSVVAYALRLCLNRACPRVYVRKGSCTSSVHEFSSAGRRQTSCQTLTTDPPAVCSCAGGAF